MFLFGSWEFLALFCLQVKSGYQLVHLGHFPCKRIESKSLSLALTQPHLSLFVYEGASIGAETPPSRPSRECGLFLSSQRHRAGQRVRQWQRTNPDRPNRAAERGQPPLHRQAFPQVQHHQEPQLYPFWHFSDCEQAVSYDLFLHQFTEGLSLIFRRPQHTWEGDRPKGKTIWEKQAHLHMKDTTPYCVFISGLIGCLQNTQFFGVTLSYDSTLGSKSAPSGIAEIV